MSRMIFAVILGATFAGSAAAQEVPGRDLWSFPLAALARPRPLIESAAGGLWNPAAATLTRPVRWELSVAALTTPLEQGVEGRLVAGSREMGDGWTTNLSIASLGVSDILRTETDPQSLGEIPYQTSTFSIGLSRLWRGVRVGGALRYRTGVLDGDRRGVTATDLGVLVPQAFGLPLRIAASTFMFSPGSDEVRTTMAAAEIPFLRIDSTTFAGAGYAISVTEGRGTEHYTYAGARIGLLDGQAGLARTVAFGSSVDGVRLGLGLTYARYRVGIAREDGGGGMGATYQFSLSSLFR